MLWIETPSNPLLRMIDIAAMAQPAHAAGALVVVDNTFLSPVWQQPLALGADIVVHSTTKYINGHSDVVGGAVIARDPELHEQLCWWANCLGLTGSPFDSFLTLRGLRTLHARLARARPRMPQQLAEWLAQQPQVRAGVLPGPADHPGHDIARRQQSGFGAMLTFELAGRRAGGRGVPRRPRLFHAGRIARRRREPGRASGIDDACGHGRIGAPCGGASRWTAAPVGGYRGVRGPARGSGGGAAARRELRRRREDQVESARVGTWRQRSR